MTELDEYPSYESIVDSWGNEVLDWQIHGDYQGDYGVLLRDGDQFGWVVIGYGSCTGCDALEGVYGDREGILALSEGLRSSVVWGSAAELAELLRPVIEDPDGAQWYSYDESFGEQVAKVITLLGEVAES